MGSLARKFTPHAPNNPQIPCDHCDETNGRIFPNFPIATKNTPIAGGPWSFYTNLYPEGDTREYDSLETSVDGCGSMADSLVPGYVADSVAELLNRQWEKDRPQIAQSAPLPVAKPTAGREDDADLLVGVFCYRISVNGPQRNQGVRVSSEGKRRRPALPVDVHFLLLAPSKPVGDLAPLSLLGWAMRVLEDRAIVPAATVNSLAPVLTLCAPQESLELVAETLPLQDQTSLWQSLQRPFRPSAAYVARMIALDSRELLVEAPPVQVRRFEHVGEEP